MEVDRYSEIPPYQQVAAQLAALIRAGHYEPGQRLPSAAGIVQETGVAEGTALKVLKLLRSQGWAVVSPGMGTYTAPRENWPEPPEVVTRTAG